MTNQNVKRIEKPWGYELHWAQTDQYVGKILFIKAGESLSVQYHRIKDETIFIQSGKMAFYVGTDINNLERVELTPGMSYRIQPGVIHQMESLEDCTVYEVSTPQLDDVVRLKDRYGREGE
jgi:mannose-6-phosphate isomerase-like protein (cupin superfamily)